VHNQPTVATDPSGLDEQRPWYQRLWDDTWQLGKMYVFKHAAVEHAFNQTVKHRYGIELENAHATFAKRYESGDTTVLGNSVVSTGKWLVERLDTDELPGFWEGIIPIWGSSRSAIAHAKRGEWGWATFNALMVPADVFLARSILTAGGKFAWKGVSGVVGVFSRQTATRAAVAGGDDVVRAGARVVAGGADDSARATGRAMNQQGLSAYHALRLLGLVVNSVA
jgi:hypothetical protein